MRVVCPIVNDPLYGGAPRDPIAAAPPTEAPTSPAFGDADEMDDMVSAPQAVAAAAAGRTDDAAMTHTDRVPGCLDCERGDSGVVAAAGCEPLMLHALRYEGDGWAFESAPPEWARPPDAGIAAAAADDAAMVE